MSNETNWELVQGFEESITRFLEAIEEFEKEGRISFMLLASPQEGGYEVKITATTSEEVVGLMYGIYQANKEEGKAGAFETLTDELLTALYELCDGMFDKKFFKEIVTALDAKYDTTSHFCKTDGNIYATSPKYGLVFSRTGTYAPKTSQAVN